MHELIIIIWLYTILQNKRAVFLKYDCAINADFLILKLENHKFINIALKITIWFITFIGLWDVAIMLYITNSGIADAE